jgi:hypothetical protein
MARTPIPNPVYVTKYGLTEGIMKFETGELWSEDGDSDMYFSVSYGKTYTRLFIGPKDWTCNLDEAKARVAKMVANKLKSIQKQMDKLAKYVPAIIEPAKENP